jgi:hypothetical protein
LGTFLDSVKEEWAKVNLDFIPVLKTNLALVFQQDFEPVLETFVDSIMTSEFSVEKLV